MNSNSYRCWTLLLAVSVTFLNSQAPDTLWTKVYGTVPVDEYAYSIQQTSDGGYIVAGRIGTEYYVGDVYLLRTDSLGDTLWTRIYGGSDEDRGRSVHETADKGYAIAGFTASYGAGECDFYLIRTDSLGDTLWTRTYGGQYDDRCFESQQTSDSGYILAGRTMSFGAGDYDFYAVKTDAHGDTMWTRTYGGIDSDVCSGVQQTSDKGYILAGATQSFGSGNYDFYLVKTDSLGDTLWTRTYGGTDFDVCDAVYQCFDNGYITTGTTVSYGAGSGDLFCLRTDENGDSLWLRYWGGTNEERGFSVLQTPDSNFIAAGRDCNDSLPEPAHADMWLLKVDQNGDTLWTKRYGRQQGTTYGEEWAESVRLTTDGGYILAGKTGGYVTGDVYLVKIAPDTAFGINENEIAYLTHVGLNVYPNPFREKTNISLNIDNGCAAHMRIYDATGRLVRDLSVHIADLPSEAEQIHSGDRTLAITWNGSNDKGERLPSGIYFLRYETQKSIAAQKVLLLH